MIHPRKFIKYLGIWIKRGPKFTEHKQWKKAECTMSALLKLIPNTGGPRYKNRLMVSEVCSNVWRPGMVLHNKHGKVLKLVESIKKDTSESCQGI